MARTRPAVRTIKMIVQSPTDRNQTVTLPYAVAWAAARGIARDTHYAVVLIGEFGTARFNSKGGGTVEWDNGEVTEFDNRAMAAI